MPKSKYDAFAIRWELKLPKLLKLLEKEICVYLFLNMDRKTFAEICKNDLKMRLIQFNIDHKN